MDPAEEQQQEIEVLESIYPTELTKISPTEYYIVLKLDTDSERKHYLKLEVKYTPQYPEELPQLGLRLASAEEIAASQGGAEDDDDGVNDSYEESDEDGTQSDDYDDDDDDDDEHKGPVMVAETVEFGPAELKALLDQLYLEAEENLGMPSVFTLASSLKEQAEEKFEQMCQKAQRAHDAELEAQEREERKKFEGTKVTKESFEQWRKSFRAEMGWETREQERLKNLHRGKMTGKELFEKGLNKDDIVEEMGALSVS